MVKFEWQISVPPANGVDLDGCLKTRKYRTSQQRAGSKRAGRIICIRRHNSSLKKTYYSSRGRVSLTFGIFVAISWILEDLTDIVILDPTITLLYRENAGLRWKSFSGDFILGFFYFSHKIIFWFFDFLIFWFFDFWKFSMSYT